MQWGVVCPRAGWTRLIDDNLVLLGRRRRAGYRCGDRRGRLGHTDGNQSLVLNTPDGVWVSSEKRAVCADSWAPRTCRRSRGIRKYAEFFKPRGGPELEHARGTRSTSTNSMVKEEGPLGGPQPPGSPLAERPPELRDGEAGGAKWPVVPTFVYGGMNYGPHRVPVQGIENLHLGDSPGCRLKGGWPGRKTAAYARARVFGRLRPSGRRGACCGARGPSGPAPRRRGRAGGQGPPRRRPVADTAAGRAAAGSRSVGRRSAACARRRLGSRPPVVARTGWCARTASWSSA